jgi:hypothetical protein
MSRLYLLSSEVNSVETYYTADSSGAITSIGTTKDFTKGFDDAILALIPNSVYVGLTNGKVWMDSATDKTAATIATVNKGLIISGDEDDVCTAGYSGINSITTNASTNTMYALSFDQRNSWITRGNEQYIDKTNLLPKDATARKAIATIDSSYDKLFDQDNTTSVSFTTATTVIPIVFAKNTKLRKVFGRLITGSIQPVKFDVAVYSDTAKGYVSIGDFTVATIDTDFAYDFDGKYTEHTKFQITITYTADDKSTPAILSELNFYAEATRVAWLPLNLNEIGTKGMSQATLQALTSAQFADVFTKGSANYAVYIPSGSSFTSITFNLPANSAPVVKNFEASPSSVHSENTSIKFDVYDLENQKMFYKVTLNDTPIVKDFTSTNGFVSGIEFKNSDLKIGNNTVTIETQDEAGATQKYTYTIIKKDELPNSISTLLDNKYTMNISDGDMDLVTLKATLNGEVIDTITEGIKAPFTHVVTWDKHKVKINEKNVLTVVLTDNVGGSTTITEEFVGDYYGLMFMDTAGKFLTNDIGELIKYLDFGTVTAGRDSVPFQVIAYNHTVAALQNVSIHGPNDLNGYDDQSGHHTGDIFIKMCADDQFLKNVGANLSIGTMVPQQKVSFYLKVYTTNPSSIGDFKPEFDGLVD